MTSLLKQAEKYCADHNHRLTDPRRAVLSVIAAAGRPLGAYDIIAAMPRGTKPPTVYRALEFWESEGFIHRIGSLGLYAACHAGHRHNGTQFMVCDDCGGVEEAHICDIPAPFQKIMTGKNFTMKRWNLELHGTCAKCA
jgi:Fur family zinc uptake transcriptional regulator